MRKIKPKVETYGASPMTNASKSKPIYPTVRLDLEHLPEAKDWEIGMTYRIEIEAKMIGISQSRFDNSAEFEIRSIEADDDAEESDDGEEKDQSTESN